MTSPAERRAQTQRLSSSLSLWSSWRLSVTCTAQGCGSQRSVDVTTIVQRQGDITLRQLSSRLRCTQCAARPGRITLERDGAGGRQSLAVLEPREPVFEDR